MDDVAQQVLLAIAFNVDEPTIIDSRFRQTVASRIRTALLRLTRGPEPTIRIESISVVDDGKQTTSKEVVYTNLKTGTKKTVEANR